MTVSVLLDTSFLITLVDQKRPNHEAAGKYYQLMLEQQVPMYFSAIVAAEFGIKQPITDLPLKNFRPIPFNIPHGKEAARLWNLLGPRDSNTPRHVARDDVKLIAQAFHESIPFILTEDASTLHKYCERLQVADKRQIRAVTLAEGFDPSAFSEDGQRGLSLESPLPSNGQ
jgi:hypothetical protein